VGGGRGGAGAVEKGGGAYGSNPRSIVKRKAPHRRSAEALQAEGAFCFFWWV